MMQQFRVSVNIDVDAFAEDYGMDAAEAAVEAARDAQEWMTETMAQLNATQKWQGIAVWSVK